MKDECLICGAPLVYLDKNEMMECSVCHKMENSKTRCVNGHYICNDCHTSGLDSIIRLCLKEKSKDPVEIIEKMMVLPFCHMHRPKIVCSHSSKNNQCIGKRCPFSKAGCPD